MSLKQEFFEKHLEQNDSKPKSKKILAPVHSLDLL